MRVLIIDDSSVVRSGLRSMLECCAEVEVVGEAADGVRGAEMVRSLAPDLVTLDLRMDGGDGLTLLEELRDRAGAPSIVVLTNYAYPEYRARCLDLGALAFLDKSTQFTELPAIVDKLARRGAISRQPRQATAAEAEREKTAC